MSPFIRPAAVRHADRCLARAVFLVLLAVYTATMVTQPDVMDGEVEYQTTSALVREGTFTLGGTPEAEAIRSAGFNGRFGAGDRADEFFSWFGIGNAFLGVPLYLAGSSLGGLLPLYEERNARTTHMGVQRSEYFAHLFVGWRNPLLGALTAALVALSSRRLGAGRTTSLIAGLTYGLTTFAWPQARSTLNSVPTTFWTFLAFHQILVLEERLGRRRSPRKGQLLLGGFAMGAAFLTRPLTAPVLLVLAIAAVVVIWRGSRKLEERRALADLLWMALPASMCLGAFLLANELRFGDPLEQGYGGVVTWESYFNYPLHLGLLGLLLSPGQGLMWMAPGCLLAGVWIWDRMRRGSFQLPLVLLGIAAAVLVPVGMTVGWHGAWGYGPRYALPVLPFLWLGVAPTLDRFAKRRMPRAFAHALFVIGFLVALPGVLVDTTTHTDLAVQAARQEWEEIPQMEGATPADLEEERFQRIRWDLRFAAPAAHWRILRHRVAGLGETFRGESLFFLDPAKATEALVPAHERERGFRHLAWVDFAERLRGPLWPVVLLGVLLVGGALVYLVRGLDPNRP